MLRPNRCQKRRERPHVLETDVEHDLFLRVPPPIQGSADHASRLGYLMSADGLKAFILQQTACSL